MSIVSALYSESGVYKGIAQYCILIEELTRRYQTDCDTKTGLYNTYQILKQHEDDMFITICRNKTMTQKCPEAELSAIFGTPPEQKDMDFLGALEEKYNCAGLCGIKLPMYAFSKVCRGDPERICDCHIRQFISGMMDSKNACRYGR